jgi:hypothetical protein
LSVIPLPPTIKPIEEVKFDQSEVLARLIKRAEEAAVELEQYVEIAKRNVATIGRLTTARVVVADAEVEEDVKVDEEELVVDANLPKWRAAVKKGKKRKAITIKFGEKRETIAYNKRSKTTKEQRLEGAKKVVAQITALGMVPGQSMLKDFGIGTDYAKLALNIN